ncbi:helix-turn-helix domain-containing protein [Variovorax sp. VNK109]|uniref:AraC-like ligand-binding domain-containing protein n=1 Tax=Variovorax sp. VNK109 TaxID=3400919 RepID=UPI003C0ACE86
MALAASTPSPAPGTSTGIARWSTDLVTQDQRLDYWVGAICEAFLEMDCDSVRRNSFDGSLQCLATPSINLNVVRAAPQEVFRTRQAITRASASPFYLISDTRYHWHVKQDGEALRLRPGDAVLVDASRPYEFHFPEGVDCLSVQMPRHWLGQWLQAPDARGLRALRAEEGWGRSVHAMTQQLCSNLGNALALPQPLIADHLGAVMAATFNPQDAMPPQQAAGLRERAEHLMLERLSQSQLTATVIADALGISPRTLHRAFAKDGLPFLQQLQVLRIRRAADMLRATAFARLTSAEVGRRCGFTDASHFTRVFKANTGRTPAQWRGTMH